MAQAKKKQSTKTAKKTTVKKATGKSTCVRSKSTRCAKCGCSNRDRNHIYFITAMSLIVAILLCINVVIMAV